MPTRDNDPDRERLIAAATAAANALTDGIPEVREMAVQVAEALEAVGVDPGFLQGSDVWRLAVGLGALSAYAESAIATLGPAAAGGVHTGRLVITESLRR